jgi:hypothetical protein
LKGVQASVINLDENELLQVVRKSMSEDQMVDNAARQNFEIASKFLSRKKIAQLASKYYKK